MTLETLLVNTVLPVLLMSTLVAAIFAYWFAFAILSLNVQATEESAIHSSVPGVR